MHVLKNGEILRSVPLIFLREAPIVKQIVGEWSNQLQLSRFPAMQIQPSLCLRTILVTQQYMRQLGRRELSFPHVFWLFSCCQIAMQVRNTCNNFSSENSAYLLLSWIFAFN
ncbi:uncharacterized protein [Euphorbia lathyris]|uniref:uncharacterized protein isoform X2 n=1 Tax=Euphorbia lathyris TaxID=212925 RepID=UPI00331333EC